MSIWRYNFHCLCDFGCHSMNKCELSLLVLFSHLLLEFICFLFLFIVVSFVCLLLVILIFHTKCTYFVDLFKSVQRKASHTSIENSIVPFIFIRSQIIMFIRIHSSIFQQLHGSSPTHVHMYKYFVFLIRLLHTVQKYTHICISVVVAPL